MTSCEMVTNIMCVSNFLFLSFSCFSLFFFSCWTFQVARSSFSFSLFSLSLPLMTSYTFVGDFLSNDGSLVKIIPLLCNRREIVFTLFRFDNRWWWMMTRGDLLTDDLINVPLERQDTAWRNFGFWRAVFLVLCCHFLLACHACVDKLMDMDQQHS